MTLFWFFGHQMKMGFLIDLKNLLVVNISSFKLSVIFTIHILTDN